MFVVGHAAEGGNGFPLGAGREDQSSVVWRV